MDTFLTVILLILFVFMAIVLGMALQVIIEKRPQRVKTLRLGDDIIIRTPEGEARSFSLTEMTLDMEINRGTRLALVLVPATEHRARHTVGDEP